MTARRHATSLRCLRPLAGLVVVLAVACSAPAGQGPDASVRPTVAASLDPAPVDTASPSLIATESAGSGQQHAMPLPADLPTRVVIPELGIDLPVVSGDLVVPGNPPDYPLCDVAQYLTSYRFPGRPGTTTWVYAHAREGMFLPLLAASEQDDGRALVGQTVHLYSDQPRRYTYEITDVVRHATDRGVARAIPPGEARLVLQTSEGPRGTVPKLQVAARLLGSAGVPPADALPQPQPRRCDET